MKYFDCHCDTLTELHPHMENLYKNDRNLDIRRVNQFFTHYGQIFALWKDVHTISRHKIDEEFMRCYLSAVALLEKQKEHIILCKSGHDMEVAFQSGRYAAFLSVEDASFMGSHITRAKELGISVVILTWNYENQYGYGAMANQKGHLKDSGRALIKTLQDQRIIIDVSHLSEAGFYDVCELSKEPFIASHSNAKAICEHPRNLSNDQLAEIINRRGICGLNFYRPFLGSGEKVTICEVMEHIEHILSLGGQDILGLGCDFDGSDNLFPDGVKGIESLGILYEELLKLNYSEDLVQKLFFDNVYQFMKRTL